MNKRFLNNILMLDVLTGHGFRKQPSKIYKHKNRNIEYYYDEKGNIKRRKLK